MAEYDIAYMQEHCIDVYFRYDGKPFHVLTYGTTIPATLNDVDRNRRLQHLVAVDIDEVQESNDVHIEQGYVFVVQEESVRGLGELAMYEDLVPDEETILQMFWPMAVLGFHSYDCVEELEDGRGEYRLVAYPGEDVPVREYNELPQFDGIEVVEKDEERGVIVRFRM